MIKAEDIIRLLKNAINSHTVEEIPAVDEDIYKYSDKIREIIEAYELLFNITDTIKLEPNTTQSMLDSLVTMLPTLPAPVNNVYDKYMVFNKISQTSYDALDTSGVAAKNWGIIYDPSNSATSSTGYYTYNVPTYYTNVYTNSAMTNLETTLYDTFIQGYSTSNAYEGYAGKYCEGNAVLGDTLSNKISTDFRLLSVTKAKLSLTRSSSYGLASEVIVNLYYQNSEGTIITVCDSSSATPIKMSRGESVSIDLPESILNDFKTKSASRFIVKYDGSDYDNNYIVYDCSCQLKLYCEISAEEVEEIRTMIVTPLFKPSGYFVEGSGTYDGIVEWDLSDLPVGAVVKAQKLSATQNKQITTGPITSSITSEGKTTNFSNTVTSFNIPISSPDTRDMTYAITSGGNNSAGSMWFTDGKVTVTYTIDRAVADMYDVVYDTATATGSIGTSSFTISGSGQMTTTITWTVPEIPANATITSCILTGNMSGSITSGAATATIGSNTFLLDKTYNPMPFMVHYGTDNTVNSANVVVAGSIGKAAGSVSFSNIVFTVNYRIITQKGEGLVYNEPNESMTAVGMEVTYSEPEEQVTFSNVEITYDENDENLIIGDGE